jgi:hypothetical protein
VSATRFFARVDRARVTRPSSNFVGLPPELTEGEDHRRPLPHPDLLILKADAAGVYLFRYSAAGEFGGDTWHQTFNDAQAQAVFEYGEAVGDWEEIPAAEPDAESYAIKAVRET